MHGSREGLGKRRGIKQIVSICIDKELYIKVLFE